MGQETGPINMRETELLTTRAVARQLGITATQVTGLIAGLGIRPKLVGQARAITTSEYERVKKAHDKSRVQTFEGMT